MINKIIIEYLRGNKRLVIPDFGAFIRKEEGNSIVFIPFLRKDDGVLETQLVTGYGLSPAEAQSVIAGYTEKIKKTLELNGEFAIERLGVLRVDANGICYLDYNPAQPLSGGTVPGVTARPSATVLPPVQPAVASPAATPVPEVRASQPVTKNPQPVSHSTATSATQPAGQPLRTETPRPYGGREERQRPAEGQKPASQPVPQRPAVESRPMQQQPRTDDRVPPPERRGPDAGKSAPRPRPALPYSKPKQQRADLVMIIAILAALIAVAVIVFGFLMESREKRTIDLSPQTEQVAEPAPATTTPPASN